MSKDCLNVLENHVSIRKFVPVSIKDEDLQRIAEVANRAPTAWNLQPVLITIVGRNELKEEISKALGNPATYISSASNSSHLSRPSEGRGGSRRGSGEDSEARVRVLCGGFNKRGAYRGMV